MLTALALAAYTLLQAYLEDEILPLLKVPRNR